MKMEQVYAAALEQPEKHPPELLFRLAMMLQQIGQGKLALPLYGFLAKVYREQGDELMLSACLGNQALILIQKGELDEAMRLPKRKKKSADGWTTLPGYQPHWATRR